MCVQGIKFNFESINTGPITIVCIYLNVTRKKSHLTSCLNIFMIYFRRGIQFPCHLHDDCCRSYYILAHFPCRDEISGT